MSVDARAMWGSLTEGLTVPNDLDLTDRAAALERLGVDAAANRRLVTIPPSTSAPNGETALPVATRAWPSSRPAWPTSPAAPKASGACASG
ncbi:hypothetical protein [Streptomyces sp. NPDC096033]|uniref:hypothetical protein n=1 Tax=Streptomyces sp. NPDC096033 TaxID=3366071 RepID=UPI0037FF05E9